jgi:DNA helicase II / ATP-dependent DNA helicase PcrA
MNLVCPADASLDELAAYYDVDCNGDRMRVYDLVARVLERCKRVDLDNTIDYDDMIWLPVALGLNTYIYDLLLVDEAQDLNRCQQALAKKCGRRLILCGDPKQAIYGFAGADAESMPRMERELAATDRGCIHLPLTVTRRCGKAIVAAAQRYVPDFEAYDNNSAGTVSNNTLVGYRTKVADGDMVLCRTNGPLVSECFKFLAQDRKATIQGRNIGKGLITTVERLKATTIIELIDKLAEWEEVERAKEEAKKNPSEVKLQNITDKVDCLHAFINSGDIKSVNDLVTKINSIFTDNTDVRGIRLSSIHKAKGLEAERVFFINNEKAPCPHPMAKTAWAREQESNLLYVGITRARAELVYVS